MGKALFRVLSLLAVASGILSSPLAASAESPSDDLAGLARYVDAALGSLESGDVEGARSAYAAFNDGWGPIEDGIRDQSKASYSDIETAMGDAAFALGAKPFDADAVRKALLLLRSACNTFITGGQPVAIYSAEQVHLAAVIEQARGHLVSALANLKAANITLAKLHAGHPLSENSPQIEKALSAQGSSLAPKVRAALEKNIELLGIDPSAQQFEAAVTEANKALDEAASTLFPTTVASNVAFQSSVMLSLLDAVVGEYGESFRNGAIEEEEEYQDAYGFFQRAHTLWGDFEEQIKAAGPHEYQEIEEQFDLLKAAFPSIAAPGQPADPKEMEGWVQKLGRELAEVIGVGEAGAATSVGSPADDLQSLAKHIDEAMEALNKGDAPTARQEYVEFDEGWFEIEDGIRAQSKDSYRAIEGAMFDAKYALQAEPLDAAHALAALQTLRTQCNLFISGQTTAQPETSAQDVTLPSVIARLDRAIARLDANDMAGAASEVSAFRREWVEVEGLIKAKSAQVYANTENNMAKAYALLTQQSPASTEARATLLQMKADLAPFGAGDVRYGIFDASIILLREGLEALLVVGALLAFLKRVDQGDKGKWIWAGSGAGVVVSIAIAFAINLFFARAAGANAELLEGWSSLIAAAMLIYVSYWLHSKASLAAWQRYIHDKSSAALARNSLLSLALIAFFAVFREGAETVLFYMGIAPSIALRDLVLGIGIGTAGLVVLGVLMFTFGVRIPVRPFFLGTSILVFYLAFKFIGAGVHALQVAGVLDATPAQYLPDSSLFGLFPTWQTTVPQLVLLGIAIIILVASRLRTAAQRRNSPDVVNL